MKKITGTILAIAITLSTFSGCNKSNNVQTASESVFSSSETTVTVSSEEQINEAVPAAATITTTAEKTTSATTTITPATTTTPTTTTTSATTTLTTTTTTTSTTAVTVPPSIVSDFLSLTPEQKNSITLLNYMSVLSQEINASKSSRVYLDETYSFLLNNIAPSKVDAKTQKQLTIMLDTLYDYRMVDVKRERLEFIYENNKAAALRSAVPNPISILNVVGTNVGADPVSILKATLAVTSLAVDSVTSYNSHQEATELQFLKDGWALDDEEAAAVHDSRKNAFNYMINMCRENNLDDKYALNEEAINSFVEAKNNTNITRRIQFLENGQEKYKYLGSYWIALANAYYDNNDYKKCLEAISCFEEIDPKIFRQNKEYAQVIPKIIIASKQTLSVKEYISACEKYCKLLVDNTKDNDWSLRYFAALSYMDIYNVSKDKEHLKQAYNIALNNVNYWIDEQNSLNQKYMADVIEKEIPKDALERQKKEIKEYNKSIKEARKKELPPICEPLYVNCELLFSLANELNIDSNDKNKIDRILQGNGTDLFLTKTLKNAFAFTKSSEIDVNGFEVKFNKTSIELPASLVSSDSLIEVRITANGNISTISDWKIDSVNRKQKDNIDTFIAKFTSEEAKKFKFIKGSTVKITVIPKSGSDTGEHTFKFKSENAFLGFKYVRDY